MFYSVCRLNFCDFSFHMLLVYDDIFILFLVTFSYYVTLRWRRKKAWKCSGLCVLCYTFRLEVHCTCMTAFWYYFYVSSTSQFLLWLLEIWYLIASFDIWAYTFLFIWLFSLSLFLTVIFKLYFLQMYLDRTSIDISAFPVLTIFYPV